MILNKTERLAFLLNDIQEMGVRNAAENPHKVDNLSVASFLLLNGISQPPVKIGTVVTNRADARYVVVSYNVKHTANGTTEEVELMREEYVGEACYRTRTITVAEFYHEFGGNLQDVI